ncbi:Zn-dependent protease [Halolamina pelagica]|uniref:Zn-dependent protease n=1 Tax=Halolamina pelagica TaxID=699431 RepID=A0A0P7GCJ5_9EURY|nr:metalloprotease [Halolamina pelagica]KPN31698.1 Zn-dependent protease [Halolamina pelagica]
MSTPGGGRGGAGGGRFEPDPSLRFSAQEIQDLLIAWLALGVAFAIFFAGGGQRAIALVTGSPTAFAVALVVSLLTAGVGFLLHELGHKVMAVRYGNVAAFRAEYNMLFLAIMSAFLGFIFAAPGAVHHRGRLTERQHGLIALAGPAVNLVLAVVFVPLWIAGGVAGIGLLELLGGRGLAVNLFLAAFNMIPIGALDGKTVVGWSKTVWLGVALPSIAVTVYVVFVLGVGF